jgi:hypothetical protein
MLHGRIGGYPCTEQRCSPLDGKTVWDLENETFIRYDRFGIPAVGDATRIFGRTVVSGGETLEAILLIAVLARGAVPARIHHAAYGPQVSFCELGYLRSDFRNFTNDFMSRDHWVFRHTPIVIHKMQIGVAYSAIIDFDSNILGSDASSLYRERLYG